MMICAADGSSAVDGFVYAGEPTQCAENELVITLYALARSLRAHGLGVGQSALAQVENRAAEIGDAFPDVKKILFRGLVHRLNQPCRTLLSDNGWWEGDVTNDPDYFEWWFSIAFEDSPSMEILPGSNQKPLVADGVAELQ